MIAMAASPPNIIISFDPYGSLGGGFSGKVGCWVKNTVGISVGIGVNVGMSVADGASDTVGVAEGSELVEGVGVGEGAVDGVGEAGL